MSADLSELKKSIPPRTSRKNGERYYHYQFDIVLLFGLTELKAQLAWIENVGRLSFQRGQCLTREIGSRKTVRSLPDTGETAT